MAHVHRIETSTEYTHYGLIPKYNVQFRTILRLVNNRMTRRRGRCVCACEYGSGNGVAARAAARAATSAPRGLRSSPTTRHYAGRLTTHVRPAFARGRGS